MVKRREEEGSREDRRRERRTENTSGSRSMKTGSGRLERAARRESGPADWRVETVVSKSLPPTFSRIRPPLVTPVLSIDRNWAAGFR